MSGIVLDPSIVQKLIPRDEDVRFQRTHGMPSISASPAFSRAMASAECDGGLVTGGSTEVQATFAGAFIRNIGADMRNFWVFTGKDSVQEILQIMAANKARILSLTPYVSSPGEPRKYAAVLVANSEGVKTTVWPDLTWEELHTNLTNAGNLRLIDLRPNTHISGNQWKYCAVAIPNTGLYYRTWYANHNHTDAQLVELKSNGWRLVHIARELGDTQHPATWSFIAEANPHSLKWDWKPDLPRRPSNSSPPTTRCGQSISARLHTIFGHYRAIFY